MGARRPDMGKWDDCESETKRTEVQRSSRLEPDSAIFKGAKPNVSEIALAEQRHTRHSAGF
jgi:hypothetical protein